MISHSALATAGKEPEPQDLIQLFDGLFAETENTRLVRGDSEPIYLPADGHCAFNRVIFAHGFFSSALHEIAHWCIAGPQRRRRVDYGYWYAPDGRSVEQQREFERVEVRPQALEWILSKASGKSFRISADNLSGAATDPRPFARAVYRQLKTYCNVGIPPRAQRLHAALSAFYGTPAELDATLFAPAEIGLAGCGVFDQ